VNGKQQEGLHYKLIYQGSKHYWKTDQVFDIHVFHHLLPDIVEVIVFDIRAHAERNRIYLNHYTICKNVEDGVSAAMEERRKDHASINRFGDEEDDVKRVEAELTRDAVTFFVLQRLKQPLDLVSPEQSSRVTLGAGLEFGSWSADKKDPVLTKDQPEKVRCVAIGSIVT
jgi:hypothetical protein